MRLDRLISQRTRFSRKEAQKLIAQRRVKADGQIALKGADHIDPHAKVELDGKLISVVTLRYFMLNKPAGYISATRDSSHPTALDLLDVADKAALHIAGRLDIDTTGLLLITDDGDWSHCITSPKSRKPKVYQVETAEPISQETVFAFTKGVYLRYEDQTTMPAQLDIISTKQARLTLYEGRYHQVKRMFGAMGNRVIALHREQIGNIVLDKNLEPGKYQHLTDEEINLI